MEIQFFFLFNKYLKGGDIIKSSKMKYFAKPKWIEENLRQYAPGYFRIMVWKGSGKNKKTFSKYVWGSLS